MTAPSALVGADVLRKVKTIELHTRRLVNTLFSGEYRSVFRGQGMEFAEVRAYEHGDDYRSIDWNVSARMGSPFVKTFVEERAGFLLDFDPKSYADRFGSVEAVDLHLAGVDQRLHLPGRNGPVRVQLREADLGGAIYRRFLLATSTLAAEVCNGVAQLDEILRCGFA